MDSQGIIILVVIALVFFYCMCSNEGYHRHQSTLFSKPKSKVHNLSSSGKDMQHSTLGKQATPTAIRNLKDVEDKVFHYRASTVTGKPLRQMEDSLLFKR